MLYHHGSAREASPIAISGRTSYLRVRLEFLRYPQLIPRFFNIDGFGLPRRLTAASPWPWVGHPVSGLPLTTCRPFGLAFAPAPDLRPLTSPPDGNSPAHSSIGTLSARGKPHGPRTACRRTVSGSLSLPLRGAFHRSLAVLCTIGRSGSLALEGGPPRFPRDSTCPVVLGQRRHPSRQPFAYGALTPYGRPSQAVRLDCRSRRQGCRPDRIAPTTPIRQRRQAYTGSVWALPRSLATTGGISFDFLPSRY